MQYLINYNTSPEAHSLGTDFIERNQSIESMHLDYHTCICNMAYVQVQTKSIPFNLECERQTD